MYEDEVMEDRDTGRCERCGADVPIGLHSCPFDEEMNSDYSEKCNCCVNCQNECAMDV